MLRRYVLVMFLLACAAPCFAKPCPARVRVGNDGAFYLDHAGVWFRQSPANVKLFIAGGCYPGGGPAPTSSVAVEVAPSAPSARVDLLFKLLAEAGWPKDRVAVTTWSQPRR